MFTAAVTAVSKGSTGGLHVPRLRVVGGDGGSLHALLDRVYAVPYRLLLVARHGLLSTLLIFKGQFLSQLLLGSALVCAAALCLQVIFAVIDGVLAVG